ncbi:MAG: glycosyltransferase [Oligoflexales bacterium]
MYEIELVIPCFNEQNRLDTNAFKTFAQNNENVLITFINDGSTDSTLEILRRLSAEIKNIEFHSLAENSGKSEAVRCGMNRAISKPNSCKLIGFWDADLATKLEELKDFISYFDSKPSLVMVIGARVKLMGRDIERNLFRHYLGRVLASFASIILKMPIYDTQCGSKVFKNNDDLRQALVIAFKSRWVFDVELIKRMYMKDQEFPTKIIEHPLNAWADVGNSKLKYSDMIVALFDLIRIAMISPKKRLT